MYFQKIFGLLVKPNAYYLLLKTTKLIGFRQNLNFCLFIYIEIELEIFINILFNQLSYFKIEILEKNKKYNIHIILKTVVITLYLLYKEFFHNIK